ncbi:amiloride-sensitive sodium channel subunit beta [Brachionus plicatilis]|uniref:Amiloride-sensitive sodium channel subunit beta n=1 Tax=Brachionus plicatilis TaxID=10195 RepID=A0A3M7T5R5_BRAPC|nr:amiloride-sensitive sodium channel subunit beta [Brachionus plicatilis]
MDIRSSACMTNTQTNRLYWLLFCYSFIVDKFKTKLKEASLLNWKLNEIYSFLNKYNWILDSTSHGFPKIIKNENLSLKLIWIIGVCLSIGCCCFFIIDTIINFSKFEVTTLVRHQTQIPLKFPAISICHNEMFLSAQGHEFRNQVLKSFDIVNIFNDSTLSSIQKSDSQASLNVDFFDYISRLKSYDQNFTNGIRKSFGFNLESYMISCFFESVDCDIDNFIWYYERFFGNCYKFNIGKFKNGTQKQTSVGQYSGIRMEFLSKTNDQVNDLSVAKGIHLALFDQNSTVNPFRGIDLSTKHLTNIIVRKRVTKKIPYPYSECEEDHSKYLSSEVYQATKEHGESYSQNLCFELCYQSFLFSKCNCSDPSKPRFKSTPVCISNLEIYCLSQSYTEFYAKLNIRKKCENDCPLECERTEYDFGVSLTDYPTNLRAKSIVDLLNSKNVSKNYSLDFVKENSLKFNIIYDSLEYVEIQELKKTEIVDLVSSIGGLLGLFIGLSLLSFAEIFEILILVLHQIFKREKSQKVIQVQPKNENSTLN